VALKHLVDGLTDYEEVMRVINPATLQGEPEGSEIETEIKKEKKSSGKEERQTETISPENEEKDLKPTSPTQEERSVSTEEGKSDSADPDEDEQHPPTILLVEDNPGVRKMVRLLIEKNTNWNFREAEDGLAAMKKVNNHKTDLIVCDIMMPNMDGYEFLTFLRQNLATATIPVLMLTSLKSSENEIKSLDLGADDYLTQPFEPKILLARMKMLLRRSKNRIIKKEEKTIQPVAELKE
jgi:PleD family two-component response regulator